MQKTDLNSRNHILDRMLKLFETQGWVQGSFARDKDGVPCLPEDKEAYAFDLRGAAIFCCNKYNGNLKKVEAALIWSLNKFTAKNNVIDFVNEKNFPHHVTKWQDAPQRAKVEVLKLVEKAKEAP